MAHPPFSRWGWSLDEVKGFALRKIVTGCVCRILNNVVEEDRDHVHASTADGGVSRNERTNLQTGAILHLPGGGGPKPWNVR